MTARGSLFRRVLLSACGGLLLLAAGCGDSSLAGSEVENEVTVVALNSDGRPAVGARVAIVPADYSVSMPGDGHLDSATVKADGRVDFDNVPSGTYNIIASLGDQAGAVTGVTLGHDRKSLQAVLKPLAILRGRITNTDTIPGAKSIKVEVAGTLASADVAVDGSFRLGIPAGRYASIRILAQGELTEHALLASFEPGDNQALMFNTRPLAHQILDRLAFATESARPVVTWGKIAYPSIGASHLSGTGVWRFNPHIEALLVPFDDSCVKPDSGVVFTVPPPSPKYPSPLASPAHFGIRFSVPTNFAGYWGVGFVATLSGDASVMVCSSVEGSALEVCDDNTKAISLPNGTKEYEGRFPGGTSEITAVWLQIKTRDAKPIRVGIRSVELN